MPKGYPNVQLASNELSQSDADIAIAERILAAYRCTVRDEPSAIKEGPKEDTDVWDAIKETGQRQLIEKLEQNDPRILAQYLIAYGKEYISFGGLSQGLDGFSLDRSEGYVAASYFDKFVCLAEALGVMPVENPEHGRWGENIYTDCDVLVNLIETELGIDIVPPQMATPMKGIRTGKGIFHYRNINSLYCAWKIRDILGSERDTTICEIGGGFGGVALYCNRFGIKDYTLVDLPLTNVISSFYLLKSLPGSDVVLYGESVGENGAIRIYPYWQIEQIPDKSVSLTLNQDSFPEIGRSVVISYLKQISRITKGWFLSVNQEGEGRVKGTENGKELNVSALLRGNENFVRQQRNRCWVREGYTDEIYDISC